MTWQVALISGAFTLLGIIVTAIVAPVLVARLLDRKIAPQLDAVHHTLSQNTNISDPPTILDEIHAHTRLLSQLVSWTKAADERFDDGQARMRRSDDAIGLPIWHADADAQ